MDETLRPIDPVTLTLLDGKQAQFLLSQGGVRRVKQRFGCKSLQDLLAKEADDAAEAILYEALLNKDGLTEEKFLDLLPAHQEQLGQIMARLMGASFPDATNGNGNGERPTTASEPPSS